MPFTLQRRQFPVRPAFAMTINKSQGQTFKQIGVYIRDSVFSHGQLYVALSRVGSRDGIKTMVKEGQWKETMDDAEAGVYTQNIVYNEIFEP